MQPWNWAEMLFQCKSIYDQVKKFQPKIQEVFTCAP